MKGQRNASPIFLSTHVQELGKFTPELARDRLLLGALPRDGRWLQEDLSEPALVG